MATADSEGDRVREMLMSDKSRCSRRVFFMRTGTAGLGLASAAGWGLLPGWLGAADPPPGGSDWVRRIADADIRAGVEAAIARNLIPSATEQQCPGHLVITADGVGYGSDTTWPGLDSWQMTGAYLLLGRTRLVLDYFEFVRASQRKDGNVPFAIFSCFVSQRATPAASDRHSLMNSRALESSSISTNSLMTTLTWGS